MNKNTSSRERYWQSNLRWLALILTVWFAVSFGAGVLFRDWFDANFPAVGGAPFGFWMAQQGSILCFVAILIGYSLLMNRLDAKYQSSGQDTSGEEH